MDEAPSIKRRLAAVLAADIAGYSRLMGQDEAATVRDLKGHQAAILPLVGHHGGRIIDTAGDGILAEFPSVVGATECAVEIQTVMAARNEKVPGDRRMLFRIGINVGDVIHDETRIYGDGINVAARLEALAMPGGVLVSQAVHDQVRDRLGLAFEDLGERDLKNIARPVRVYRLRTPEESRAASVPGATLPLPDKPSIAVLAFQNMSGDPEQEYFSDGITEDIITNLSKHRGFFVIARNSSFTYKGQAVDVTRVGRELGVRYVLEGSVRKAGSRVRITGQLIDATNGSHLWAEKYDRDLNDLFAVQDEITREIVGSLAPEMLEAEMQRARRKDPQSLDAWEYAIRAQWHLARLTREDNAEALRLATQSTHLNPAATAGLNIAAFAHIYDSVYGWSASSGHSIVAAHEAARRAVALDPRDEASQTALGASELFLGHHDAAVARLRNAVELNPNFPWAHGNLGLALAFSGEGDEAAGPFKEAVRLSPRDQFCFLWIYLLGFAAFMAGRNQEALDHVDRSLRLNSSIPGPYRLRAACLSQLGRMEEARASLTEFLRLAPNATIATMREQLPLKKAGDFERYARALKQAGLPA